MLFGFLMSLFRLETIVFSLVPFLLLNYKQGLQVQEYSGNFCKRVPTDIDLPAVSLVSLNFIILKKPSFVGTSKLSLKEASFMQMDSDKTIMVTFKHDDKFQEGAECGFQVYCY